MNSTPDKLGILTDTFKLTKDQKKLVKTFSTRAKRKPRRCATRRQEPAGDWRGCFSRQEPGRDRQTG